MAKNHRKRMLTQAERSLWSRAMSSVLPSARPQDLAMLTPTVDGKVVAQLHTKKVHRDFGTLPTGFIKPMRRTSDPFLSVSKALHTHLSRVEIGQVGDTDRRTANKLKRGKLDIDARLDLHGYTEDQAYRLLISFIQTARVSGARCILVVTGKGRKTDMQPGKLKTAVPRWLNEPEFRPSVLSVTYAQQRDGGDGALYILLRKGDRARPANRGGGLR